MWQEDSVPAFKKKLKAEGEEGEALPGASGAAASSEEALPDPSAGNSGCVFVNDLAPECTEKEIRGSFKRFGFLDTIHINYDKQCGYVTFLSAVSAVRAVNEMNGSLFCGRHRLLRGLCAYTVLSSHCSHAVATIAFRYPLKSSSFGSDPSSSRPPRDQSQPMPGHPPPAFQPCTPWPYP